MLGKFWPIAALGRPIDIVPGIERIAEEGERSPELCATAALDPVQTAAAILATQHFSSKS
jgi:hypothetical protein